jgi:hypothetical protein
MKTLSLLLTLVLLVTVVAVNGSRAQPLPGLSTAFQQCVGHEAVLLGRCLPIGALRTGLADFGGDESVDIGGYGDAGGYYDAGGFYDAGEGDQFSSPDLWREIAVAALNAGLFALAGEVARWAGERLAGGGAGSTDLRVSVPSTVFDPAP